MIVLNITYILLVFLLSFEENHTDLYSVDGLDVDVNKTSINCLSGFEYTYFVDGEINSDLLFIVTKLFDEEQGCITKDPQKNVQTTVILDSTGGYTAQAYELGRLFRKHEIKTVINNNVACSSACAIVFLGGSERYVSEHGMINFHQPYTVDSYVEDKPVITCSEDTTILLQYFIEMTNDEMGNILYNRSLLYCGTDEYWQIYGTNAALLYGVVTK